MAAGVPGCRTGRSGMLGTMEDQPTTADGKRKGATTLAALAAEQARQAPGHPWVEHARTGRAVPRSELADVVAAWSVQGVAGRRIGLPAGDPVDFAVLFVALI